MVDKVERLQRTTLVRKLDDQVQRNGYESLEDYYLTASSCMKTASEISRELDISRNTVRTHMYQLNLFYGIPHPSPSPIDLLITACKMAGIDGKARANLVSMFKQQLSET